ncbi:MAG TPA: hypothetical protein VMV69_06160 [Pirellulales bacterium]|nr:hypothetical protein [Pirellulales bacterium]
MNRPAWSVAAIVAAVLGSLAWGADSDSGGGAHYSPTRAEWLCVLLNSDQAAASSLQFADGAGVVYHYDQAQPDSIQIEVLYNVNVAENQRRHRAQHAERQAREMAKLKGWDDWLKINVKETKITRMPAVKPLEK